MSGDIKKLAVCGIGIFVCYFCYGIMQEKITRGQYGTRENPEKFTYMFALIFCQSVSNYLFAKTILKTVVKQGEDTTKTFYYLTSSLTYLLAMLCSNMALEFLNYPTQLICKSGKPVPVMILGVFLGRKSYSLKKYIFVLMVVIGVIMFMYKENNKIPPKTSESFGTMLLILSLTMDGLTSAAQERMKSEHQTKSLHMMLNMNFWATIFCGIIILTTGELFEFLSFAEKYPALLWQLVMFSCSSALGQYFIFLTISEFGPLPCSLITTTRKFFSVLASVIFFGNSLLLRQWVATILIFLGLFLDSYYGKSKSIKKETVR